LNSYEKWITEHSNDLVDQLSVRAGQSIEVTEWLSFFGFDAMGSLAFGRSFGMLKTGGYHPMLRQLESVKRLGSLLLCASWLMILLRNLPLVKGKSQEWLNWCARELEERRKVGFYSTFTFSARSRKGLINWTNFQMGDTPPKS
jgi:hypothetical protein